MRHRVLLVIVLLLGLHDSQLSAQRRASGARRPTSSEIIARRVADAAARENRRKAWASRTAGISIEGEPIPAAPEPIAEPPAVARPAPTPEPAAAPPPAPKPAPGPESLAMAPPAPKPSPEPLTLAQPAPKPAPSEDPEMDEAVGAVRDDLLGLERAKGWVTGAEVLAPMIVAEADRYALPPALVLAIIHLESEYNPVARSSAGATGLMQVMPFWPKELGYRFGSDLTDRATNLRYGIWVLQNALDQTGGDVRAALLRYNGCRTGSRTPSCFSYPDRIRAIVQADARGTCAGKGWEACVVMPIRLSYGIGE